MFNKYFIRLPWNIEPPPWAGEQKTRERLILKQLEKIMLDVSKLTDIVSHLQASDTVALALLQTIKDQNTHLAGQLAAIVIPVADTTTQSAIDAVVASLTDTANKVDAAVAANSATPNLAPSPPAPVAATPAP